jgi:dihydroneopterin aldolase
MDKILITGLIANGIVGVKEPEREFPQELLLDIELEYPLTKAGVSDSIEDTISYSYVAKLVRKSIQDSSITHWKPWLHTCQRVVRKTPLMLSA